MTAEEILQALGKVTRLCEVTRLRVGEDKCKENCPFVSKKNHRCLFKNEEGLTMTNFDWIRNMTDNELVQFMRLVMISGCGICSYNKICRKEGIEEDFCSLGVEQWLKQEHEENSND